MEHYKADEYITTEEGLMTHEVTPKDRLQNQIRLASDLFLVMHGDTKIGSATDIDFRNNNNLFNGSFCKMFFC